MSEIKLDNKKKDLFFCKSIQLVIWKKQIIYICIWLDKHIFMFCVKPVKYDRCASQNVQDIIRSVWWCFHGRFSSIYIYIHKYEDRSQKSEAPRIGKLNTRMIWDWAGFDDTFSCNLPNGCEWPRFKWAIFASFRWNFCLEIRNLWTRVIINFLECGDIKVSHGRFIFYECLWNTSFIRPTTRPWASSASRHIPRKSEVLLVKDISQQCQKFCKDLDLWGTPKCAIHSRHSNSRTRTGQALRTTRTIIIGDKGLAPTRGGRRKGPRASYYKWDNHI